MSEDLVIKIKALIEKYNIAKSFRDEKGAKSALDKINKLQEKLQKELNE